MKNHYNIAIDGPAGAGKSTIAKKIAEKLSFIYMDTGAMYRAMAYYMLLENIDLEDKETIGKKCEDVTITIEYLDGEQQIFLNGENITKNLRAEEVGTGASKVAKHDVVRKKMVDIQRSLAASVNVIMDGRDIGTVVLPHADLKIYLTAGTLVRAERRYKELTLKNISCDIHEIEKDIKERDYQDMNREVSPLRQAEDAVLLDTSDLTIDEVVEKIIHLFKEKTSK